MRSRSSRWAIERIESRGFALRGVEAAAPTSSGSPSVQAAKPGEASRLLSVIASSSRSFAGIERLEVEHADALEGRALHAADQLGEIEVLAFAPRPLDHVREQDVLAAAQRIGLDAEQREQARPPPPPRARCIHSGSARCAGGGAASERSTESGRPLLLPGV